MQEPPEEAGIDAPAIVQQYIDETYDAADSIPSCRRLLKETGLSYQKPRRTAAEADSEEQDMFHEELNKAQWTPQ